MKEKVIESIKNKDHDALISELDLYYGTISDGLKNQMKQVNKDHTSLITEISEIFDEAINSNDEAIIAQVSMLLKLPIVGNQKLLIKFIDNSPQHIDYALNMAHLSRNGAIDLASNMARKGKIDFFFKILEIHPYAGDHLMNDLEENKFIDFVNKLGNGDYMKTFLLNQVGSSSSMWGGSYFLNMEKYMLNKAKEAGILKDLLTSGVMNGRLVHKALYNDINLFKEILRISKEGGLLDEFSKFYVDTALHVIHYKQVRNEDINLILDLILEFIDKKDILKILDKNSEIEASIKHDKFNINISDIYKYNNGKFKEVISGLISRNVDLFKLLKKDQEAANNVEISSIICDVLIEQKEYKKFNDFLSSLTDENASIVIKGTHIEAYINALEFDEVSSLIEKTVSLGCASEKLRDVKIDQFLSNASYGNLYFEKRKELFIKIASIKFGMKKEDVSKDLDCYFRLKDAGYAMTRGDEDLYVKPLLEHCLKYDDEIGLRFLMSIGKYHHELVKNFSHDNKNLADLAVESGNYQIAYWLEKTYDFTLREENKAKLRSQDLRSSEKLDLISRKNKAISQGSILSDFSALQIPYPMTFNTQPPYPVKLILEKTYAEKKSQARSDKYYKDLQQKFYQDLQSLYTQAPEWMLMAIIPAISNDKASMILVDENVRSKQVLVEGKEINRQTLGSYLGKNTSYFINYEGTFIHELCHHGYNIIYKNASKPYDGDIQKDAYVQAMHKSLDLVIRMFEKRDLKQSRIISNDEHAKNKEALLKKYSDDQIKGVFIKEVARVFVPLYNGSYGADDEHVEFIVRIPQLISIFQDRPKIVDIIKQMFKPLIEYQEKYVTPMIAENIIGSKKFDLTDRSNAPIVYSMLCPLLKYNPNDKNIALLMNAVGLKDDVFLEDSMLEKIIQSRDILSSNDRETAVVLLKQYEVREKILSRLSKFSITEIPLPNSESGFVIYPFGKFVEEVKNQSIELKTCLEVYRTVENCNEIARIVGKKNFDIPLIMDHKILKTLIKKVNNPKKFTSLIMYATLSYPSDTRLEAVLEKVYETRKWQGKIKNPIEKKDLCTVFDADLKSSLEKILDNKKSRFFGR